MTTSASQTKLPNQPTRVVVIGNGAILPGIYRSIQKEITNKDIALTIVSTLPYHVCYALMGECISGAMNQTNLVMQLETCFPNARHIRGNPLALYREAKQLLVRTCNGQRVYINYDHLIVDDVYFTDQVSSSVLSTGFIIQSVWDMLKTKKQLEHLVERAAVAGNHISASRLLTVCVGGAGTSGIELAAYIGAYLQQLCRRLELSSDVKPLVYLIANDTMFDRYKPGIKNYISEQLKAIHVKVVHGKQIVRVNADGAILQDGSFISCSLVYNTLNTWLPTNVRSLVDVLLLALETDVFVPDKYSRLKGNENIWLGNDLTKEQVLPSPLDYTTNFSKGEHIGRNIIRSLKNQPLRPFYPGNTITGTLGIGAGFVQIGGIQLTGVTASLVRWLAVLLHIPSFNRSHCFKNLLTNLSYNKRGEKINVRVKKSVSPGIHFQPS